MSAYYTSLAHAWTFRQRCSLCISIPRLYLRLWMRFASSCVFCTLQGRRRRRRRRTAVESHVVDSASCSTSSGPLALTTMERMLNP